MTENKLFANIVFENPECLYLIVLMPIIAWWHYRKNKKTTPPSLLLSTTQGFATMQKSLKQKLKPYLPVLIYLSMFFIIIALSRPQAKKSFENTEGNGIDIILSMDISGSMLAEDFAPNRMEAAKEVAINFVKDRVYDRIGLVIFSGESFSQCPLTTDHNILINQIQNIRSGLLADGTAIGMGLATAVDRLRLSDAKSKVIILLTDGVNNGGLIDPETALEIAKAYKIKVYTIGVGTQGNARMPIGKNAFNEWVYAQAPVEIDEKLMEKIATETGAKYYRCTDNAALEKVYKQINTLEKSHIEVNSTQHYSELFGPFLSIGLLIMVIEFLLAYTYFKSFP